MPPCSKCKKDPLNQIQIEDLIWVCDNCGYDMDNDYEITKEEIKILWEFLKHEYISYENLPLLELVRKISSIANENE